MIEGRFESKFSDSQKKFLAGRISDIPKHIHRHAINRHERAHFVFVDVQRLWWECLTHVVGQDHPGISLSGYDSVDDYLGCKHDGPAPDAIILHSYQSGLSDADAHAAIRRLVKEAGQTPVVLLSDNEDIDQMISVLDCGVKGYIPASIGLSTMVETMKTAASGGFLLTSHGLDELRSLLVKKPQPSEVFGNTLTMRQSEVAEALREGKSNKTIAYELDMRENTVKVHVRNILKRLHVTNRTEAALKLNETNAAF